MWVKQCDEHGAHKQKLLSVRTCSTMYKALSTYEYDYIILVLKPQVLKNETCFYVS